MRALSSIQNCRVETQSGRSLGRCHDVRCEFDGQRLRVTGLCVGGTAWLAHLGVRSRGAHTVVPWESVVRIDGKRIIVRDETRTTTHG